MLDNCTASADTAAQALQTEWYIPNRKAHAHTLACIRKQLDKQARAKQTKLTNMKNYIWTWHGTLAKKIAVVRTRVFNATVDVGNKGARSLRWISTAHKHNYLFKIIHKRRLKVPKKEVQLPPKSSPRNNLKPKLEGSTNPVRNTHV